MENTYNKDTKSPTTFTTILAIAGKIFESLFIVVDIVLAAWIMGTLLISIIFFISTLVSGGEIAMDFPKIIIDAITSYLPAIVILCISIPIIRERRKKRLAPNQKDRLFKIAFIISLILAIIISILIFLVALEFAKILILFVCIDGSCPK